MPEIEPGPFFPYLLLDRPDAGWFDRCHASRSDGNRDVAGRRGPHRLPVQAACPRRTLRSLRVSLRSVPGGTVTIGSSREPRRGQLENEAGRSTTASIRRKGACSGGFASMADLPAFHEPGRGVRAFDRSTEDSYTRPSRTYSRGTGCRWRSVSAEEGASPPGPGRTAGRFFRPPPRIGGWLRDRRHLVDPGRSARRPRARS